ncbi:MAG: protein BatD, partial [Bacteroidales bacterium]
QKGLPEPFYEEVSRAMWGYLSDKLSIPTSELSRQKAVESLQKLGVDQLLIDEVVQWLDACEYARYAPSATRMEMHELYKAAGLLIGKMQMAIREIMKRKS